MVAGPRLCVSPRVLRCFLGEPPPEDAVPFTVVPVMVPMSCLPSRQRRERQIQNRRSAAVNFGRSAADLCSTPIWCRKARFLSSKAARELRIEGKTARSVLRKTSISENSEARISHNRSEVSRFSVGTIGKGGGPSLRRLSCQDTDILSRRRAGDAGLHACFVCRRHKVRSIAVRRHQLLPTQ